MNALSARLAASPELFPHALDPVRDSLTLIKLTEADYAKASFLDGRLLSPSMPSQTLVFTEVQSAVAQAGLAEACNFIFHIGHVGSTLLSRLMGAHAAVFALREPAILRTLVQMRAELPPPWDAVTFEGHLSTLLKLWSRRFHPGQRALVKATSFASELASEILTRAYRPKAIFMAVSPANYLATILGAENSPQEARALAPFRLARLNKRLGSDFRLDAMTLGEMVAMSWATEMMALAVVPRSQEHIRWQDFDRFLAAPALELAACFRHLGIAVTEEQAQAIVDGPDMRRYSKAQEYDYDAKLRGDILAQARADHGAEIKRGLAWLERAATQSSQVQALFR